MCWPGGHNIITEGNYIGNKCGTEKVVERAPAHSGERAEHRILGNMIFNI